MVTLPSPCSSTWVRSGPGPLPPVAKKGASPAGAMMRLRKRSKRQVARLPVAPARNGPGVDGGAHAAAQVAAGPQLPRHVALASGASAARTSTWACARATVGCLIRQADTLPWGWPEL